MGALLSAVSEPQIRSALESLGGICVTHLRQASLSCAPQALCLLARLAVQTLTATDGRAGAWEPGRAIWGEPPDPLPAPGPQDGGGLAGADPGANPDPPWPSYLSAVRSLFPAPGCPLCFGEQAYLGWYLSWLAREATEAPEHSWQEARWLCRSHWHALCHISLGAAARVASVASAYWKAQLQRLTGTLAGRRGLFRGWPVCLPRGPVRSVRDLEAYLQAGRCPACDAVATGAQSAGELLAAVLEGTMGQRAYERMGGVCLRHLPFALEYCRESDLRGLMLRICRRQLRILKWELAEYQRKETWSARYEPRAAVGRVWLKAAAYLAGLQAVADPHGHI